MEHKRTLKDYPKIETQNPIVLIQDLVHWTNWISSIGRIDQVKDWKENKTKMIDYLENLNKNIKSISLNEHTGPITDVEFHTMLVIQLRKLKHRLSQLTKLNPNHKKDLLYIRSVLRKIIRGNKDLLDLLEEEDILELFDEEDKE